MMKMVMVAYNEAIDMDVMEMLENCGVKNYTKITATYGKGTSSGTHLGDDIWPGRNNILYVACDNKNAQELLNCIKALREKLAKEGIKAFVWDLEEIG